jgi:hypothetical protein
MISRRGAVMVESALVIPLILLVVYGSVQLGMVGLEQLTVDGGAYTSAHQQALLGANLKNYEDAPTLAKATLPRLNSSTMTVPEPTFGQAPTTSDTTNLAKQYNLGNANARHGGVSMVQPVQTVGFVTSKNFASLLLGIGNSISVTGIAIDPAFRLINGHGDVSGNNFNTAAAFQTATDPLVNGNNAPPYFVGFNYIKECPYTVAANKAIGWNGAGQCPQPIFAGLGLAEYLDVDNWGRPVNGVVPALRAVFYEAQLHQNKFANIATNLSSTPPANKWIYLNPVLGGAGGADVQCVYSFDNVNLGTYNAGTTKIGDYPLSPAGNLAVCGS